MKPIDSHPKEFSILVQTYGVLLDRKKAQKGLLKISDTLWEQLNQMGVIEPIPVEGRKGFVYSLFDLIALPEKLKKEKYHISDQL